MTPHDWNNPNWAKLSKTHEWKKYISEEVQQMWDSFTDVQKQALARQAESQAENEEWE